MSAVLSAVPNLDQILMVAAKLPVLPCLRQEQTIMVNGKTRILKAKSPHIAGGLHSASQDPEQIRQWWARWPDALVGVPTGAATGIIAIDYDVAKKTQATDDWVRDHSADLMTARIHETRSGGKHWIFRNPPDARYRTGSDLKLDGSTRPGIDVRAEGGYIIWWPVHGGKVGEITRAPPLPKGLIDDRLIGPEIALEPLPVATPEAWAKDREKVAEAIRFIDPTGRDEWIMVGMALHYATAGSDEGFTLWHEWSTPAPNYEGIEDCRYHWASFKDSGGKRIGLGSLFKAAKDAGFKASVLLRDGPESPPRTRKGQQIEPAEYLSDEVVNAPVGERLPSHLLPPGTDMAACRRLWERHGHNIRFAKEASWLVWDGTRWCKDEKAVMVAALAKESAETLFDEIRTAGSVSKREEIYKAAKIAQQKRCIESAIWLARSEMGVPVELVTFDADPWILNVQNGILDLVTGELKPHDKEARCSMIAGAAYEKQATAPRWQKFISEICMGNASLMDYMQRVAGYIMTADVSEQCLFFMHGSGSNGKSTFVETMMRILGDYATASEPDLLMTRKMTGIPADVAKLRGCRAVFLNETKQGVAFDEAKLKNLTGGDTLEARFMRENFFTFRPTHKLMLRGNYKPTVNGTDEGIWRRLKLIPFDLRMEDSAKDRTLGAQLLKESSGILNWMIQGCLAWQKDGLKTPAVVAEAVAEYREESDTMARFMDERCEVRANAQVKGGMLYEAYREFCEQSHERALSGKDFPRELVSRNPTFSRKKSNGVSLIIGIELKQALHGYSPYID